MKLIPALALSLAASCQPVMAASLPADLRHDPIKFCTMGAAMSAVIMMRINSGENPQVIYEEANRVSHPGLGAFLNESTTLAQQFARHSSSPVDHKLFAQWNYERCMNIMRN